MTSIRKFDNINSNVKFQNISDSTISFYFDITGITGSKTYTLPNANTQLAGIDTTQTLTNKTINALNNTLLNIANSSIATNAAIDVSKIANGAVSNTEFQYLDGVGSSVVGISDIQTLTNKTINAANNTISNISNAEIKTGAAIDASKIANGSVSNTEFQYLDGVTSSVVGISDTQTLTNKTINAANNTITNISDTEIKSGAAINATKIANGSVSNTQFQYLNALGSAAVGVSDTLTLTNKTFGDNLNMNSNKIINLAYPTSSTDAATRSYVDDVVSGLDVKASVVLASTADLGSNSSISGSVTYTATGGSSGRGQITATLASSNSFVIDGVTLSSSNNGSRILLKDQTSGAQNGIWTTTISGTSLTLNRATDFDADSEVTTGAFTFVEQGTVNANSGWVLVTANPIVIGGASGTSLSFSQFSGAGQITAGTGMTKTGNTLNVGGSATIIANADNLEVNSSATANQILLSSGTVGVASTFGSLPLGNSNAVSGTLPIARGGTNTSSYSNGNRLIATNSGNTALVDTSLIVSEIETRKHDTQTTSNGTTTTISTISTSSGVTYLLQASVVGHCATSNEAVGFVITALYRNDSGTLTLVEKDSLEIKDSSLSWVADVTTSGTNIIINITGEASKTISWTASYNTVSV